MRYNAAGGQALSPEIRVESMLADDRLFPMGSSLFL